jgi:outer membrane protein
MERVHGWPLDFVGYAGVMKHNERGLQPDVWQLNLYMKAVFYGFPWSDRVKTRLGFGAGVSFADHILFVEQRDQARRGRSTSKILNYLDPTIDVSVGDLIGARALKGTFAGLGISHRSGIFGTSQLLGNVNGGSNYIYSYLEWRI